jgi:hypothetical protein
MTAHSAAAASPAEHHSTPVDGVEVLGALSPSRAGVFAARLSILQGGDGATYDAAALNDPGYLYNRSRELRTEGREQEAVVLLATRPVLSAKPHDPERWIDEHLNVARIDSARGNAGNSVMIRSSSTCARSYCWVAAKFRASINRSMISCAARISFSACPCLSFTSSDVTSVPKRVTGIA